MIAKMNQFPLQRPVFDKIVFYSLLSQGGDLKEKKRGFSQIALAMTAAFMLHNGGLFARFKNSNAYTVDIFYPGNCFNF